MIFWKSLTWPSYSWEWLLNWLHWHLVPETSSFTVKTRKSALQYFRFWMSAHVRTQHWSCSSMPTDYGNSHASGPNIQNSVITGHSSQLKMNGPLSSMSLRYSGHFDNRLCGCWRGLQSHCITWSPCTMTCSIIWMAWCELWPRRTINGRKTCSSLWS